MTQTQIGRSRTYSWIDPVAHASLMGTFDAPPA